MREKNLLCPPPTHTSLTLLVHLISSLHFVFASYTTLQNGLCLYVGQEHGSGQTKDLERALGQK